MKRWAVVVSVFAFALASCGGSGETVLSASGQSLSRVAPSSTRYKGDAKPDKKTVKRLIERGCLEGAKHKNKAIRTHAKQICRCITTYISSRITRADIEHFKKANTQSKLSRLSRRAGPACSR